MTPSHRSRRRLPARVYWFRRVMVLSVAAALVVGIASLLGSSSDEPVADVSAAPVGSDTRPGPPVATATPGAAGEQVAASPSTTAEKRGKKGKRKKEPLPEPTGPCDETDVVVAPAISGAAHAGSPVTIRLEVTSKESEACTWQVSSRTVAVKLVSGSDRIWTSQDCPRAVPNVEVVARQKVPGVAELRWHGQRSDSDCSRTTPWALAGWYHAQAAAFGAEPASVQFELLPAVAPTITPTPEPKKKSQRDED